jgi:hypothetical protein
MKNIPGALRITLETWRLSMELWRPTLESKKLVLRLNSVAVEAYPKKKSIFNTVALEGHPAPGAINVQTLE